MPKATGNAGGFFYLLERRRPHAVGSAIFRPAAQARRKSSAPERKNRTMVRFSALASRSCRPAQPILLGGFLGGCVGGFLGCIGGRSCGIGGGSCSSVGSRCCCIGSGSSRSFGGRCGCLGSRCGCGSFGGRCGSRSRLFLLAASGQSCSSDHGSQDQRVLHNNFLVGRLSRQCLHCHYGQPVAAIVRFGI